MYEFPLEEALKDEVKDILEKEKQSMREEMLSYKQAQEVKYKEKEQALQRKEEIISKQTQEQLSAYENKLKEQLQKQQQEQETTLRKKIAGDFENQLKVLRQSVEEKEEREKEFRQKELDFLHKEKAQLQKESELEIKMQRQLLQEREQMRMQLQKEETEKSLLKAEQHNMQVKELEKKLEDQKKLADEMKRRADQGSMQLQGEVQELELESILRSTFIYDEIVEVPKGTVGADCIQLVKNQMGAEAGKIIYESKRTKNFTNEWIEKLKTDMRSLSADVAIIVTQVLPKEMDRFGEKEGIYICTFSEVRSVVLLLRNGILKIAEAKKSQENKGDKMVMLYDYLTCNEFVQQWNAIREGFFSLQLGIQKERDAMERLWKRREKELEKVLLNSAHIAGSIEGIAGTDTVNLRLIEDDNDFLLDN